MANLVLVAEDEPTIASLVADELERAGHQVVIGTSGLEALTFAIEHWDELCALVTDVRMMDMDGVALAAEVRRLRPDLFVIVITGRKAEAIARGAEGITPHILSEPFRLEQVFELIGKAPCE